MKLVLTCEHGGNRIPEPYVEYFKNCTALGTHRGYDIGALDVFEHLVPLSDASFYSTTSRLLIELNRSLHHHGLFSEWTKGLPVKEKNKLIKTHYQPYREEVTGKIEDLIGRGESVVHLSIHSFTPLLNGVHRNCDIGLLYDARREKEKSVCKILKDSINREAPNLKVRFNYPYLGRSDGFTTFLRKHFPEHYVGVELEFNQKGAERNEFSLEFKKWIYQAVRLALGS